MDPIATLLLARTHTVVLDRDRVASAATRPARDADVDRFEDELLQLGFVLSLDLAMTIRRLPHETLRDLKTWMLDTLAASLAQRPHVPQYPLPASTTDDPPRAYVRRVLTWLVTRAEQPCPWCARTTAIAALDPCGHLVCRACWSGGRFAGCAICHRRVAIEPFLQTPAAGNRVEHHDGELRLVHLALDVEAVAQARFERLLARTTPLSKPDIAELETMIDTIGPKVAIWLPKHIPVRETMALAVARLWIVAPDRTAMMKATHGHITSATDVLRIAAVLMKANAALVEPMRLTSIPRSMRRALLEAIEKLPVEFVVEEMRRRRGLWKRVGERLHPGEWSAKLPNVARAFAAFRTRAPRASWAGSVERHIAAGDAAAAAAKLAERPDELLCRFDHVVRLAAQPDAIVDTLRSIVTQSSPRALLQLAAHVARRGAPWPRRVVGDLARAWTMADTRAALPAEVIAAVVTAIRTELVARAAGRRNFARAVVDRGLADLFLSRGGDFPLGDAPRISILGPVDATLEYFDDNWRHVRTGTVELDATARHAVLVLGNHGNVEVDVDERRFAARGNVPLAFDLAARRLRFLDVRLHHRAIERAGGYRAALAHVARDFADLVATRARPTLWDVVAVHAAARANTIYVRATDSITTYKRRDGESHAARLARLHAGEHDGTSKIPPANAPTWFALLREDGVMLPKGSEGFVYDTRSQLGRMTANDLVMELRR